MVSTIHCLIAAKLSITIPPDPNKKGIGKATSEGEGVLSFDNAAGRVVEGNQKLTLKITPEVDTGVQFAITVQQSATLKLLMR